MTPLGEFKKSIPEHIKLTEDELASLRELVDLQTDLILDSYIVNLVHHT